MNAQKTVLNCFHGVDHRSDQVLSGTKRFPTLQVNWSIKLSGVLTRAIDRNGGTREDTIREPTVKNVRVSWGRLRRKREVCAYFANDDDMTPRRSLKNGILPNVEEAQIRLSYMHSQLRNDERDRPNCHADPDPRQPARPRVTLCSHIYRRNTATAEPA